jgi:hypothetical protein
MRTLFTAALVVILASIARGQDAARAIIEKAVEAHGGAALDKYPAGRAKAKGTIVLKGAEYPFSLERVFQTPDKLRITSEVVIMNIHRPVTCIVKGSAVTAIAGGLAQDLPPSQVSELKAALYMQNIERLTPLLKDKRFRLAALEPKTIEGQPADGVLVSSDGHNDVRFYFDAKTNLLVAVERPGFDDQGKAAEHIEIYSDFREVNGLKYPTKTLVKQNGRKYMTSETTEFKPLEKVDAKEFQVNPS